MTQMGSPCKICRNLQNRPEDIEESEAASLQCLNITVQSLHRSAAEGCSTCQLISQAIEAYSDRVSDLETDDRGDVHVRGTFMPENAHQFPVSITLYWKNTRPEPSRSDLKIELYTNAGEPLWSLLFVIFTSTLSYTLHTGRNSDLIRPTSNGPRHRAQMPSISKSSK